MTLSGINAIGSLYTRNTAASSSTTTMVPSLSPPSEKEDEPESEDEEEKEHKQTTETKTNHPCSYYCHYSINDQKPHYGYDDYRKSKNDISTNEENQHCLHKAPISTAIPIPPYIITTTTKTSSSLPRRILTPTTSSSMTSSPESPSSLATSPKKKAKRWMIAALMVIVGLLIALTFILIGLGKAIGHHQYHDQNPLVYTNTIHSPSSSLYGTHTTTTIIVVPTTTTIIHSTSI